MMTFPVMSLAVTSVALITLWRQISKINAYPVTSESVIIAKLVTAQPITAKLITAKPITAQLR